MKQKYCLFFLCIALACFLSSCGWFGNDSTPTKAKESTPTSQATEQPTATPTPTPQPKPQTARDVADALKNAGLPIGEVIVVTKDNDSQHMLGKPNQYTSRVLFKDTRVGALPAVANQDVAPGGCIEVFASAEDAGKRVTLIQQLADSMGFPEYDYQQGTVVLRVSHELTKDQADTYGQKLKAIMN